MKPKIITLKKPIFLLIFLSLLGCTKDNLIEDPILGKWQFRITTTINDQFWYASIIFTFNNDGTGTALFSEGEISEAQGDEGSYNDPCYLRSETGFNWSNLSTDLLAPQQTYQFINNYITCSSVDLSERSIESRTNVEIIRFNSDFTEFIKDGDVYVKM